MRAVRAAWEMQQTMSVLNEKFGRRFGSRIALRIGVNTGEVVAGDATSRQTIITGDAANVAARLEQAAEPGEVLIGDQTYRLVRDAVQVQTVAPLTMKGKAEPVSAHRLIAVEALAAGRVPPARCSSSRSQRGACRPCGRVRSRGRSVTYLSLVTSACLVSGRADWRASSLRGSVKRRRLGTLPFLW